jgi:hypothetical protein
MFWPTLFKRVRSGDLAEERGLAINDRFAKLKISFLGDAVMRRRQISLRQTRRGYRAIALGKQLAPHKEHQRRPRCRSLVQTHLRAAEVLISEASGTVPPTVEHQHSPATAGVVGMGHTESAADCQLGRQ